MSDEPVNLAEVREIVGRCGGGPDAAIPILQAFQEKYGWLPQPALEEACRLTKISPTQLWGVATFYAQFRFAKPGRNLVRVCRGTACHVSGAGQVLEAVTQELRLKPGEDTTADGKYTVEVVACLGCCSLSPVIMIGERAFGKLTARKVRRVLKEFPG